MTGHPAGLTGTGRLVRFIVRRDRVRILSWVVALVALVGFTAAGIKSLFPTQADLDRAAIASQGNAAVIVFNGPAQGLRTVGGEVAFQAGAMGMVVVALMSLLMVGRLTRGEEEAGRLEMLRSLPTGRHAPTLSAVLVVVGMNVAVAVLATLALLGQGLPAVGSVTFGLSFLLVGLVFVGVALLAAQISEDTRVVYGASGAALGAAFVLRAVGDIGDGTVSWLSPIGWVQKARPFAGERWSPFLLPLAATATLLIAAGAAAARRDLGAGLLRPRPGRSTAPAGLASPLGLAVRLQRGSFTGWMVGVLVTAVAYGLIAPSVDTFIGNNQALADMLAPPGGGSLTDSYFATSFRVLALIGAGFAVQATLRLRSEETALHAEPLLATPVSRWRWAASHLSLAASGSVILLAVAGAATGMGYAAAGGPVGTGLHLIGAALVYTPATWLLIGLTVALIGLTPRASGAAWAILGVCFTVAMLGPLLRVPGWLLDMSPFQHVPHLPAAPLAPVPLLALTAIAAGLTLAGLVALRHRDIG